ARQALLLADLEDTVPVPVHDEGDDLVDLLVVQLAALGATPGGHRVARRREGPAARDRVRQELADCVVVGLLAGLGVVVLPGRRAAGAVLVVRTVQRKPDTDIALTALPVAIEAEAGIGLGAVLRRGLELFLLGRVEHRRARVSADRNAGLERVISADHREYAKDERDREQRLPIGVGGDLERIGRLRYRRRVIRRGLL